MRKKEIIELLKLYEEKEKIESLSKIDDYIFPKDIEISKEIEILKKEKNEVKIKFINTKNSLHNISCNHQVRLTYPMLFGTSSECVICGKGIYGDHILNGTIYNDPNRNRYYASFNGTYEDEDLGTVIGFDRDKVSKYIIQILKDKLDDEEVDLVQEMKKANIKKCNIVDKPFKKEYFVLIIGGSNKKMISDDSYLTSSPLDISIYLSYYFNGLPNTNVEIIDNSEAFISSEFNKYFPYGGNSSFKCVRYETISELINEISNLSKFCPFNLIIDASNLNEFEINDNHINIKPYNLNLKSLFPDRNIIRFIKPNDSYKNGLQYYINDEIKFVEGKELDDTCKDIKKLLLK